MNRMYRTLWNEATGTTVAVAEITKRRSTADNVQRVYSPSCFAFLLTPLVAALAMAGFVHAGAPAPTQLPMGGSVTAGTASIASTTGAGSASMTITQSSQRAVVDWTRFDVGSQAQVNFVQPSASSVTLNRVLSSNPSQIFGRINANGQVFLTNPSGVYFAPGSSVDVGGLVATTHSIGNDAFMAGSNTFNRYGAIGTVQNDGTLTAALGGYIALLAPTVRNQGVVVAKMGTVAFAAGETFTLHIEGGKSLTGLEVTAATVATLVDNGLAVQAPGGLIILSAQALDRLQGGVVNNSGVLQANGLVNDGGRIMLRASNKITHTGSITADAASAGKGGTVTLIADLANLSSRTEVNGSISAKGGEAGGDGGFIETSASKVRFGDNMAISTLAAPGLGGRNGTWLIDPTDFTIASSGGDMTGTALGTSLASGNVTIYSSSGASGSDGDINVDEAVSWSANTLTLNAQTDINVNAAMTGSGTAVLAFQYGQSAVSSGNSSTYNISAAVSLPSGSSFSTQLGTDGAVKSYTVITSLGSAGDQSLLSATNSLQGLAYSTRLSGNYVLGADIAASETSTWNSNSGFSPIGSFRNNFTGTFDGLGHTISGLTINRPTVPYLGLFGYITSAGSIRNVGLLGASVSGWFIVGGLVGNNAGGTISSSYATGSVNGSDSTVGGLVGANYSGTISSSYATGSVSGPSGVGGLVGNNAGGTIISSYATGSVSGNADLGGLSGYNRSGTIISSYATGSVSGIGSNVGGLVGYNDSGTISSNYATGSVSGTVAGGLVGAQASGTISSSYATGSVSGGVGTVGGLVGINYSNSTITSSYFNTTTSGQSSGVGTDNGTSTVTGLSSTNILQQSNLSSLDFTNTWYGYDGYTYPLLRTFLTALTVTANASGSKTYDSSTACGTITCSVSYTTSGTKTVSGTASYTLSSENAGTVSVLVSGLYSDQQGYLITTATGTTATIAKAPLTITGSSASTTYTGLAQTVSGYNVSGLVGSDTTSSLSGVSASVSGTNVGSYTNTVTASTQINYTVTTVDGALSISEATSASVGSSTTVVISNSQTLGLSLPSKLEAFLLRDEAEEQ